MKRQTITIVIGGCALGFTVANTVMARSIKKRYHGWIAADRIPFIKFICSFMKGSGKSGDAMPRLEAATFERGCIARMDFRCAWSQGAGTIRLNPSIYSFDACLRVLFSALLPLRHTILVHASAITARSKRGYVFAGRSGAGKTTMVRLLSGATALNDELCVLRVDNAGRVWVSGTPFWGEMGNGPAFPNFCLVAGLYFLNKQPAMLRVPLGSEETCARLLGMVCQFSKKVQDVRLILAVAERIARAVSAYELRFRPSRDELLSIVFKGEAFNGT